MFPEVIAIDQEIRSIESILKNPELTERHRNGYEMIMADLNEKRQKLLDGLPKRT